MATWSSSLLKTLDECLSAHEFWTPRTRKVLENLEKPRGLHLAVFAEPFLTFLLEGRKTIESRFSVNRTPPFGYVRDRDLVLIKASGGPIVALAEVAKVWYYELTPDSRDFLRSRFSDQLCVDPEFWESKAAACFATLMQFSWVDKIEPIECSKRDRRGWVVF